jgi:hypothetical protein
MLKKVLSLFCLSGILIISGCKHDNKRESDLFFQWKSNKDTVEEEANIWIRGITNKSTIKFYDRKDVFSNTPLEVDSLPKLIESSQDGEIELFGYRNLNKLSYNPFPWQSWNPDTGKNILRLSTKSDRPFLRLEFDKLNFSKINISSGAFGLGLISCNFDTLIISPTNYPNWKSTFDNISLYIRDSTVHKYIRISRFWNGKLTILTHLNRLVLDYSPTISKQELSCANVDTLLLYSIDTTHNKVLSLYSGTGRKTDFFFKDINLGTLNFNYIYFKFDPFLGSDIYTDSWYLENQKKFHKIIENQRKNGYNRGVIQASIDSAAFEDQQFVLGETVSKIKRWWNGYGFEKGNVVFASLEMFGFFFLLNFCVFRKLLNVYDFANIQQARQDSFDFKYSFLGSGYRFLLCMFYSGFIFYGFRFEFKNFKIDKVGYAFIIIIQYVLGLVSLAYIANLIITK